jgi:hypothetical protein
MTERMSILGGIPEIIELRSSLVFRRFLAVIIHALSTANDSGGSPSTLNTLVLMSTTSGYTLTTGRVCCGEGMIERGRLP